MNELVGVKDKYLTESDAPPIPAREKILMALLNPEFIGLTVTEEVSTDRCFRQAWYTALHDPAFMELVNKTSLDVLKEGISVLWRHCLKCLKSSPKSNPDRRLLFELTGHTAKEINGNYILVKIDNQGGD